MSLVQLYIPVSIILDKENILEEGREFRFKVAPLDPYDPFRGKYINLSFEQSSFQVTNEAEWVQGTPVFITMTDDEKGFAKIASVSKEPPAGEEAYIKAISGYVYTDSITTMAIHFPFDRFYMEESKAENAEKAYNDSARDSTQITYALVSVMNGDAVIKDVLINGVPIKEVAKNYKEEPAFE